MNEGVPGSFTPYICDMFDLVESNSNSDIRFQKSIKVMTNYDDSYQNLYLDWLK